MQETVEDVLGAVRNLVSILEGTAKAGFPVTITFGLDIEATLLQGQCGMRFWAEPTPAVQSGTYYISAHRRRFQFNVDLIPLKTVIEPKIEVQGKFIHSHVAGLTVTFEGKIEGSSKIAYSVTDTSGTEDFRIVSRFPMSVSGKGEASAASFYALIEGTAHGAITHAWTAGFDGEAMTRQVNALSNDALTLQATFRWGNKIWQWCGFGSDEPTKQWPEDGPFVWLKKDELKTRW